MNNLLSYPRLWENISSFHPNDQDEIIRAYLQRGSCQTLDYDFPKKEINGELRQFNPNLFKEYKNWLEKIIKKDDAFCLYCYILNEC